MPSRSSGAVPRTPSTSGPRSSPSRASLEERRQLIKAELGSADEGALFQIANKFAIRHQRAGQQADYDPAFLDWIFWWYLATVELTERIISRAGRHERLTGRPFSDAQTVRSGCRAGTGYSRASAF